MKYSRTLSWTLLGMVLTPVCSWAQAKTAPAAPSVPPLWGSLRPGPHHAGFRTLFRYDRSRTWKPTRTFDGRFSPDLDGRPIQLNVWYPSSAGQPAKKMVYADYVNQTAPDPFAKLNEVMWQRNRDDVSGSVPRTELSTLEMAAMNADRDAPPEPGRFPVVLYFGGLNGQINANAILSEYLASYGYVVASISLVGPSSEQTFQSRTPEDLEASTRDMEFAWSILQDAAYVDPTKVAAMGHSVGAIEAILLGMRDANISAVIGLDGTYGFRGSAAALTQAYGYAADKLRAPLLDLRRAEGAQGSEPLDFTAAESFRHSDRTLITIDKMHHSDFTSFAMIGAQFHVALPANYPLNGWTRETGREGYERSCRIVLAFLDATLKSAPQAVTSIDNEARMGSGVHLRRHPAVPPPPSLVETASLAEAQGIDAVKQAFVTSCGASSLPACMDISRFNDWGYNLLGQKRPQVALAVFQLNAWAHPASANSQDSLADGYLAVNDKENAAKAIAQAILLAPADPLLSPSAKESFIADEKARLQKLR